MAKIPRGIRNNNPLNIRVSKNKWVGKVKASTDPAFEQFAHMYLGIRAGFVILRNYIKKYKRNTIRKIVSAWAPSIENNTAKYIETVAKTSGIGKDDIIQFEEREKMIRIVSAMIKMECGAWLVGENEIEKGYEAACANNCLPKDS